MDEAVREQPRVAEKKPKRPRTPRPWLDYAAYLTLRLAAACMTSFPARDNLAWAAALGDGLWLVDRKHRRRALENLRASFPDMPEAELRRTARRSMRQFFALFVEVMFTPRKMRLESLARHVDLGSVGQTLALLLDDRRGALLLTGHYGNWEVLGYVLALMGFETTSVARPLDNPHVNAFVLGVREAKGQRVVDKKGATAAATAVLESRGTLGLIADQDAGKKGLFVDFFGRPASTYKSIGLLAMEYDVPVVIGYARRRDGRLEFEMGTSDVIWPEDWKGQPDPLRYITQRYTTALQTFVTGDPGQYLWVHRRWKTRPRGERPAGA